MGRIKLKSDQQDNKGATTPVKPWLKPPWQPGQSGNPKGRIMDTRNKLSEKFIADLGAFYEVEGASLIKRLADENPTALIQVIARLLPKETRLEITTGNALTLTADQRTRIAQEWLVSQNDNDAIEGTATRIEATKNHTRERV